MIKNFILFILLVFGFSSCSKEESNQNASSAELKQVVLNYANIVHASYVDSLNLAKNMQEKINNFLEAPSQKGLDEAKQSWVD
ncbi:MAG: imelysin, partial [Verrucomicrobiota bacterium]|nr:imelysin [Verrucomicrobiota bacterium]